MADKPSYGWGAAKLAAAMATGPIGALAAPNLGYVDDDVAEWNKTASLGAFKGLTKAFLLNPAQAAMTAANTVGAGIDAITGSEGDNSIGRRLGRTVRSGMQRVEEEHPLAVAASEASTDIGLSMTPGGGVPRIIGQAASKAGGLVRGASTLSRLGAGAVEGAVNGLSGVYQAAAESAHQQALKNGDVDYGKAVSAGLADAPGSVATGAALGAAGPAVVKGLESLGKIGTFFKSAGANQFARESGMLASEIKQMNVAGRGRSAELAEELLGDSSDAVKAAKKANGIAPTPYDIAAKKAASAEDGIRDVFKNAQGTVEKAAVARSSAGEEAASKLVSDGNDYLNKFHDGANAGREALLSPYKKALAEWERAKPPPVPDNIAELVERGIPEGVAEQMRQSAIKANEEYARAVGSIQKQIDAKNASIDKVISAKQADAVEVARGFHAKAAEASKSASEAADAIRKAGSPIGAIEDLSKRSVANARLKLEELANSGVPEAAKHIHELDAAIARHGVFSAFADAQKSANKPFSEMGLLDAAHAFKKRFMGKGVVGGAAAAIGGLMGGPKVGMLAGAVGSGLDSALSSAVPNYASRGLMSVGSLAEAMGATFQVDAAARGAVNSLFGKALPIGTSTMRSAFLSEASDRDQLVSAHIDHVAKVNQSGAIMDQLERRTAHLPLSGRTDAAARLAIIEANIQRNAPIPVVQPGVFGEPPKYDDVSVHKYEDYVSVSRDASVALKAMRTRQLTPAMAEAMKDNHPELVETMRDQFIDSVGGGESLDDQSARQMEVLFGEPILPQNRKDFKDLMQRAYDMDRRTDQPGSQGGGSRPSSKNSLSSGSKTPMDSLGAAR